MAHHPRRARVSLPLPLPLAIAAGAAAGVAVARRARSWRDRALSGPVRITYDTLGVPAIVAGCRDDALFGLGYATASQRMFQIDLLRRAALGRLSELIGADGLGNDRLMRLVGMQQLADGVLERVSADGRGAIDAYAAGVNCWLRRHPRPAEFRALRYRPAPWQPRDTIAIGRLMGWMLGAAPYSDLVAERVRRLLGDDWAEVIYAGDSAAAAPIIRVAPRDVPEPEHRVHPLVETHGGSNAWAVSGERSVTGRPLLASDPHLAYNNPSIWHEARLEAPGFHVTGMAIPGVPVIGIGRTPTLAWGFTATMTHQTFLYRERLNDAGDAVADGTGWAPLRTRTESIAVRGRSPETLVVRVTPRGPLFSDLEPEWCDDPVSLHWTGMESSDDIDAMLRLNAAITVDDALAARDGYALPPFNMAAADSDGNIAAIAMGRLACHPEPHGLLEPTSFPPRYVPTAELPFERNPARGWTASANGRIVDDQYPYALKGGWEPRFRIERIAARLEARPLHSPADMLALQLDRYSPHAAALTPCLLDVLGSAAPAWALVDLREWNYVATVDSRPTLLFHAFYHHWLSAVLALRLPPDLAHGFTTYAGGEAQFGFYDRLLRGELDAWFDGAETRIATARRAFAAGLRWIEERQGPNHNTWTWGAAHTLTFKHPFGMRPGPHAARVNVGPFPMGGDRSSIWLTWWEMARPFEVAGGSSMRFVADLRNARKGWLTNTLGQSGRPFSRHYRDQTAAFLTGGMHSLTPRRAERVVVIRPDA